MAGQQLSAAVSAYDASLACRLRLDADHSFKGLACGHKLAVFDQLQGIKLNMSHIFSKSFGSCSRSNDGNITCTGMYGDLQSGQSDFCIHSLSIGVHDKRIRNLPFLFGPQVTEMRIMAGSTAVTPEQHTSMNMIRTLCQIPISVYVLAFLACICVTLIVNRSRRFKKHQRLKWSHVVATICLRPHFRSVLLHRRLAFLNLLLLAFFLFQVLAAVITSELVTTIPATFLTSLAEVAASDRTPVFRAGAGSLDKIRRESGPEFREIVRRHKQVTSSDIYLKYLKVLQSNQILIDTSYFARIAQGLACVTQRLETKFFDLELSTKSMLTFSRRVDGQVRRRVHGFYQRLLETGSLYFYSRDPLTNFMPEQVWQMSRCQPDHRTGGKNAPPSPPGLQLKNFRIFFYLFAIPVTLSCILHLISYRRNWNRVGGIVRD